MGVQNKHKYYKSVDSSKLILTEINVLHGKQFLKLSYARIYSYPGKIYLQNIHMVVITWCKYIHMYVYLLYYMYSVS